jgi:hypothetical protein
LALLATQAIVRAGLQPVYGAVSASDTFVPDKETFLHVKNGGGSPDTVAVVTPRTDALGHAVADDSVSVPATTGDRLIGPFPAEHYADPTTGLATVTHSFTTSVTAAVLRITQP